MPFDIIISVQASSQDYSIHFALSEPGNFSHA